MQDVPLTHLDTLSEPRNRRQIGNGGNMQYTSPTTAHSSINTIADMSFFGPAGDTYYKQQKMQYGRTN
jgi:hypothetical protein